MAGLTVTFCWLMLVASPSASAETEPLALDLPTVLRLAGGRSIDVEIARQELHLARAEAGQVRARFFPWLSPGGGYRRHEGATPDIEGVVLENADKDLWEASAVVRAQVDVGETLFAARSARRAADAAGHGVDAAFQDAVFLTAIRYFELLAAQASEEVFTQARRISVTYGDEIAQAVEAGLASRSEQLRVRVEIEKNSIAIERAREERRVAAARLAQVIRVGGTLDIVADRNDIAPVQLVSADTNLDVLVAHAVASRGEIQRSHALVSAARESRKGVVYGPLLPSLDGQVGFGGLGGGPDGQGDVSGDFADYGAAMRWRIGPGGLFDFPRIEAAAARLRRAELEDLRWRDLVTREVVEAHSRSVALAGRLASTTAALATTEEVLSLARQRREFGIDVVLENILAEQEQTRTRADYLLTVIDWNRAQYGLLRALGGSTPE
ncbi:MAG: TolC family protein [Candidatus Binatia bacterium]